MKSFLRNISLTAWAVIAGLWITMISMSAHALDTCYTGSYSDPAYPGVGIDMQVSEDVIVVYRYGFMNGEPIWHVAVGENSPGYETYTLTAYQVVDLGGETLTEDSVGSITIQHYPESVNELSVRHYFQLDLNRWGEGVAIPWCLSSDCKGDNAYRALFRPIECAHDLTGDDGID